MNCKSWKETCVLLVGLMAVALVGSKVFSGVNNFAFEKGGIILIIIAGIVTFYGSSEPKKKDSNPYPFLNKDNDKK